MNGSNEIRKSFADWSSRHGNEFQITLYEKWEDYRVKYFDGADMVEPVIELLAPNTPQTYGCYLSENNSGLLGQILVRPSLYTGSHPHVDSSAPVEGRVRFVLDVLLHEMVHQYAYEILGEIDFSYNGHGPFFRNQCNRIGKIIGLPPVRTCKKRGRDAVLPSCSQWPHNVRPEEYYLGAYKPPIERKFVTMEVPVYLMNDVKKFIKSKKNNY